MIISKKRFMDELAKVRYEEEQRYIEQEKHEQTRREFDELRARIFEVERRVCALEGKPQGSTTEVTSR